MAKCTWEWCSHEVSDDGDECDDLHCHCCAAPIEGGEYCEVIRADVREEAKQTYGGGVGYPTETYCATCAAEVPERYVVARYAARGKE